MIRKHLITVGLALVVGLTLIIALAKDTSAARLDTPLAAAGVTKDVSYYSEILPDGQIQVKQVTRITDDGNELSSSNHRHVLTPGDDLSKEHPSVADIARAIWTPNVIATFRAEQGRQAAKRSEPELPGVRGLTKRTVPGLTTVYPDGRIKVTTKTQVLEDGTLLSESFVSQLLIPGDAITTSGTRINLLTGTLWNQSVIEACNRSAKCRAKGP